MDDQKMRDGPGVGFDQVGNATRVLLQPQQLEVLLSDLVDLLDFFEFQVKCRCVFLFLRTRFSFLIWLDEGVLTNFWVFF